MKWATVIVAAGRGARLGRPKQFLEIAGLPIVGWSIQTFAAMNEIAEIVIATEPELIEAMRELARRLAAECPVRLVGGGALRQDSVFAGLREVSSDCDAVLVHDGARPLVCATDVRAGMRQVRTGRAALLAAPVIDTIKSVEPQSRRVTATLDRRSLWAAQTPQFALTGELRVAHERARRDGWTVTDDAALLERAGVEVVVVPPTSENFKVTFPADIARAEAILETRRASPSDDILSPSTPLRPAQRR